MSRADEVFTHAMQLKIITTSFPRNEKTKKVVMSDSALDHLLDAHFGSIRHEAKQALKAKIAEMNTEKE